MDRPQNDLRRNAVLCSKPGCSRQGVYYCQQKNMIACLNCYQDHLVNDEVLEIKNSKSAQQVIDKIGVWLKRMKDHGLKYSIETFHTQFFTDMKYYEDKLMRLEARLIEARESDNYVEYTLIENKGYTILKNLMKSNVIINYSTHYTQSLISIETNENFIKPEELLQNEIREHKITKLEEDLSKALQKKFNRDVKAEKRRLKNILEQEYSQENQEFKSKAEELKRDNSELKNNLDECKKEKDTLLNSLEKSKGRNKDLKSQLKEKNKSIKELKSDIEEAKKNYSDLEESSKETVSKLKKNNQEKGEIIEKMEEESKNQLIKIENLYKLSSYPDEYLPLLYKTITGRDGGTGINFNLCIDWSNTTDKEAFNYARLIQLKEIEKLHFISVNKEENSDLLDFLVNKSPKKLNAFTFSTYYENCSGDFYLKGFEKIASVTSKKFRINYFKFSKSAFENILKANANCNKVKFFECDFDLDSDIDISGPKYSTSFLSIRYHEYSIRSKESKSEILNRIIKAISLSSLKDSLKALDFSFCGVDKCEIQKKLKEFNLEHIGVRVDIIGLGLESGHDNFYYDEYDEY